MNSWYLITGATGGLGKAFCAACAKAGHNLYLTDVSATMLNTLSVGLQNEYGIEVLSYTCNLASEQSRDELFTALNESGIRFSGLINIAGMDREGEFSMLDLQCLRTMMQLNMFSAAELINRILQLRSGAERFTILNVASQAALQPMPYKALYAATKRFLLQLSLALNEELKPQNTTVTALCPSGMPTTQACLDCMKVQGFLGSLTTMNTGDVAEYALKKAKLGKPVVVPGMLNRIIKGITFFIPETLTARILRKKWSKALLTRCGTLLPGENICGTPNLAADEKLA